MNAKSPCRDCPDRRADPNCHNPETCEKWEEYLIKHEEERLREHNGRMKYAGEAKQTIDSCRRNAYYQAKKRSKG